MNFSNRLNWGSEPNAIARAVGEFRSKDEPFIDLTETNPTKVSLPYLLGELAEVMGKAARAPYRPDPRGLRSAREALAREIGCDPERIVLTASTSEAYSFLLRLLLDAGDHLLTFTPGYPLFEHLADLDGAVRDTAPLEFQRRWHFEQDRVSERMTPRTRMVAVVSPNNPTGSYVTAAEQDALAAICERGSAALVSDEVFSEFAIEPPPDRARPAWLRDDVLSFSLGGLSKSAALPHFKLAWICVGGPQRDADEAVEGLELIADTFLSVSTIVQEALPDILRIAPAIRTTVLQRIRANAAELRRAVDDTEASQLLPVEGGWSAVLRVPRVSTDEALVLELLERERVLVHPGYFFDFARDGFLVLSLLPPVEAFRTGIGRLVSFLRSRVR